MDMFYIAFYYSNHTHKVKEKILDVYLKSFKENLFLWFYIHFKGKKNCVI